MRNIDLSLYLVTDRNLLVHDSLSYVVEEAVKGGVTAVQLREKELPFIKFLEIALELKNILKKYNVPFLINDRVDIAWACDADGVHLGQTDMDPTLARKLLGKDKIIGVTIENNDQLNKVEKLDLDYIALSIYPTPTKTDAVSQWGLEGLSDVRSTTAHKIVGIGSMNKDTAGDVIKHGADGIAVVSAICSSSDVFSDTSLLRTVIDNAKEN